MGDRGRREIGGVRNHARWEIVGGGISWEAGGTDSVLLVNIFLTRRKTNLYYRAAMRSAILGHVGKN